MDYIGKHKKGPLYSALMLAQEMIPNDRELIRMILEASLKEKDRSTTITESDNDLVVRFSKWGPRAIPPLLCAFWTKDYESAKRLVELGAYDDPKLLADKNPWLEDLSSAALFRNKEDPRYCDLLREIGFSI